MYAINLKCCTALIGHFKNWIINQLKILTVKVKVSFTAMHNDKSLRPAIILSKCFNAKMLLRNMQI